MDEKPENETEAAGLLQGLIQCRLEPKLQLGKAPLASCLIIPLEKYFAIYLCGP